jgi:hypothetical protein
MLFEHRDKLIELVCPRNSSILILVPLLLGLHVPQRPTEIVEAKRSEVNQPLLRRLQEVRTISRYGSCLVLS